jgi:hypothetical protein
VHIGLRAGGGNAGDGPKDKPDVALFLAEALNDGDGLFTLGAVKFGGIEVLEKTLRVF